jgi:hypothetical protein
MGRPPVAAPELQAPAAAAPASSSPASSAANLALRLGTVLQTPEGRKWLESTSLPESPGAVRCWEAQEALKDALRKDPAQWRDVIDLLASGQDRDLGIRVVRLIRTSVNDQSESVLVELLATMRNDQARWMCVTALAGRDSNGSIHALSAAAARDSSPGVRLASLNALIECRDRSESAMTRQEIADVIRERGRNETDSAIRDVARRVSGDDVPVGSSPPPAPPRRSFGESVLRKPGDPPPIH